MKYLFVFSCMVISTTIVCQNVGVGTTNPASNLHVKSSADTKILIEGTDVFFGSTSSRLHMSRLAGGAQTDWEIINTGPLSIKYLDNLVGSQSGEKLRLLANGNLGLKTSSPQEAIHIKRSVNENAILRLDATGVARSGIALFNTLVFGQTRDWRMVNSTGGNLQFEFNDNEGTPQWSTKVQIDREEVNYDDDGHIMFGLSSSANMILDENEILARNDGQAADLYIQNDGGDLLLCKNENGGVGIGVGSGNIPNGYLLAVDGKIVSEEIRVELSSAWPDYVFEKDYELMPINEVAKKIETLGHLPGIPSAAEMKKEGQLLGQMQIKMMEKIEELTIYIIELNTQMENLKLEFSAYKAK